MRALFAFVGLSSALHVGAAVWLAESLGRDGGGGAEVVAATPQVAVLSGAAIRQMVETWERPPDVRSETTPLQSQMGFDKLGRVPAEQPGIAPGRSVMELAAPVSVKDLRPPAVLQAGYRGDVAESVKAPVLPKTFASEFEVLTVLPGAISTVSPAASVAVVAKDRSFTVPDHPGPELSATPPPKPRSDASDSHVAVAVSAIAKAPSPKAPAAAPSVEPGVRDAWAAAIRMSIARHHHVPDRAARRGLSGRVVLRVTVEPDGGVTGMAIRASSGHDLLDRAALSSLRRAGRLPRAPGGITRAMTFDVPLTFRTS